MSYLKTSKPGAPGHCGAIYRTHRAAEGTGVYGQQRGYRAAQAPTATGRPIRLLPHLEAIYRKEERSDMARHNFE